MGHSTTSRRSTASIWTQAYLTFALVAGLTPVLLGQSLHVNNPSFEANKPGGAGVIDGWTSSDASATGIIANSGTFFDGAQSAYLQPGASLTQTISGFDPSKLYTLQYQCFTSPGSVISVRVGNVSFSGSSLGNTYGWNGFSLVQTPSVAVIFTNAGTTGTVQLDGISLRARLPDEIGQRPFFNQSFEGSDSSASDGAVSPIAGWTSTGATGVNPSLSGGSAYADNGVIPDGEKVAFLRATASEPASLTSAIPNFALTPGQLYRLHFRYNASAGTGFDPATMTVKVGSSVIASDLKVIPVGGDNAYYTFDEVFTAPAQFSSLFSISNSAFGPNGASALLVDDFAVLNVVPEPTIAAMAAVFIPAFAMRRRRIAR